MFYSVALVPVVLLACACSANAFDVSAQNNGSFSEILSNAMNYKGNYSDYLSLLKEKCETQHLHLTSYEQQCCMRIAHAKAHVPFSIIRQNTDIMQFTNDIDPSLFKILLSHFSNNVVIHDQDPARYTEPEHITSMPTEYGLKHCLADKSACLEELARFSLHAEENAKMAAEIINLNQAVARQTALNTELENEVRILREQRDADQQEVAKLTAELESTVQHLLREEENTLNMMSERDKCRTDLGLVDQSLSKCQLNLFQTKNDIVTVQGNLTKCSTELASLETERITVAAIEEQLSALRRDHAYLQRELEQSQLTVNEKDAQLAKCTEFEPLLVLCEHRLGHCHNSSSETEDQWQEKYDDCSTKLNLTINWLVLTKEEKAQVRIENDRLIEAEVSCQENYTIQKNENERLLAANSHLEGRITTMTSNIEAQSMTIVRVEEQLDECVLSKERTEALLLSLKNDLFLQLESYNRLQLRYHEQSNKTLIAQQAKETCQLSLEEIQGDYKTCSQTLEGAQAEVISITKVAEQCVSDHKDCNQHLEIASAQLINCSSTVELDSWKALHEQCRAENIKCEASVAELSLQLKQQTDLYASCQEKLAVVRGEEAHCQLTNSELRSTLKTLSDTHGDAMARLQELSASETSCQQALASAKQDSVLCQETVAELRAAKEQCLAELNHQMERIGALEEASAELSVTYTSLSSRFETCQQERHSALVHVSRLNGTVASCNRIVDELSADITSLETELGKCLESKNLTHADLTEWQERHERCLLNIQLSEQRYVTLTEQCDSWQLQNGELDERLALCEGQLTTLHSQRQSLLIQVEQWRMAANLANQTATECTVRLQLSLTEVLQYQTSVETTTELVQRCTEALHSCENPPPRACPFTDGNNTYTGVDRTVGLHDVISAEDLAGCYMTSYDSAVGRPMKHFCHSQQGHLFKIPDEHALEFVGQAVATHNGKFLVEPSAYFASQLGLDLKQYGSNEEVCYYVEGATASSPQLKHTSCAGQEFHAMCWAEFLPGYDYVAIALQEGTDASRDPDYLNYSEVEETDIVPDYLDY